MINGTFTKARTTTERTNPRKREPGFTGKAFHGNGIGSADPGRGGAVYRE
jgi:hypothetical protein